MYAEHKFSVIIPTNISRAQDHWRLQWFWALGNWGAYRIL